MKKDPVTVEYLAAIQQQSGEDWTGVDLVLSTAQASMLNAAPPGLLALDVDINHTQWSWRKRKSAGRVLNQIAKLSNNAQNLRRQAQQEICRTIISESRPGSLNSAAASENNSPSCCARTNPDKPMNKCAKGSQRRLPLRT